MNKIYLVSRGDKHIGYDENVAFIVVAKSPGQARSLCAEEVADEGAKVWEKAETMIIGYPRDSTPRIILNSLKQGKGKP